VIAKTQRLVPVLLDDVALPPFVAARVYVDFRRVNSDEAYRAAFDRLVRAVRDLPQADRPAEAVGLSSHRRPVSAIMKFPRWEGLAIT